MLFDGDVAVDVGVSGVGDFGMLEFIGFGDNFRSWLWHMRRRRVVVDAVAGDAHVEGGGGHGGHVSTRHEAVFPAAVFELSEVGRRSRRVWPLVLFYVVVKMVVWWAWRGRGRGRDRRRGVGGRGRGKGWRRGVDAVKMPGGVVVAFQAVVLDAVHDGVVENALGADDPARR